MKVLVVGGGGREHALTWKLAQSARVDKIFIAPGNAGTATLGENLPIAADDIVSLKTFALKEGIGLTVVGPEVPLSMGIVDIFKEAGLRVFGPTRAAAELEASKGFCKEFMLRHNIKSATYKSFTSVCEAEIYIDSKDAPLVVKADGLAAGKGVFICPTALEAKDAVKSILTNKVFGTAGQRLIIEDFLQGEEASFLALTDGVNIIPLAPSQDHKAIGDGDTGPNTGGMGAYSPTPVVTKEIEERIIKEIIGPVVRGMREEGRPYSGLLYAGLMIDGNSIKVLEFNCRFGDPETQPILARLKSDLFDLLLASAEGDISGLALEWDSRSAICVVMSAHGYPGKYEKGHEIIGIKEAEATGAVMVFHAATAVEGTRLLTAGGRVLGITGLGKDIKDAIKLTYAAVDKIKWDGAYCRRDIGAKATLRPSKGGK